MKSFSLWKDVDWSATTDTPSRARRLRRKQSFREGSLSSAAEPREVDAFFTLQPFRKKETEDTDAIQRLFCLSFLLQGCDLGSWVGGVIFDAAPLKKIRETFNDGRGFLPERLKAKDRDCAVVSLCSLALARASLACQRATAFGTGSGNHSWLGSFTSLILGCQRSHWPFIFLTSQ